jgi:peptidoglycan hydrolase-like protein with peptidoglycan-binding domain
MSRRRTIFLAVVGCVGVAAGVGLAAGGFVRGPAAVPAGPAASTATAHVVHGDLVETKSVDGRLGYGPATPLTARATGTVTALAPEGTTVSRGQTVYSVDNRPVTLLLGVVPMYRELRAGDTGQDVQQLEQNLKSLGYNGFTVDDKYTSGTVASVKRWQRDRGLERTGRVGPAQVMFAPEPLRVAGHILAVGAPAGPGAPVVTVSSTRQVVSVDLDVADRALVRENAPVTVVLPGGTSVPGHVSSVGTVAKTAGDNANKSTVTVEIGVDQAAPNALDQAPVKVNLERGRVPNALSVPVAALVAVSADQYAVEVVEGSARRRVPVKVGTFADGRVQIEGVGITERTVVGVPSS